MWPILGPIEYYQAHRSTNFNSFQHSLFGNKSSKDRMVQSPYEIYTRSNPSTAVIIESNIRYVDPISSMCLILYSLILLLLCTLPILAFHIYLRQAFDTFHQTNSFQIDS